MNICEMPKVIGYEFKNASYVTSKYNQDDDAVIVKEVIHYDNGDQKPNLRILKNYERSFYVVLDRYQRFNDKRVYFDKDKMKEYRCTQRGMTDMIKRVTRMGGAQATLKYLNNNPYLFGTDIRSTTLIKQEYMTRWPDLKSNYRTAHLDIEREVEGPKNDRRINMISVTIGNKVFQYVARYYLDKDEERFIQEIRDTYKDTVVKILDGLYNTDDPKLKKKYKVMPRRDFDLKIEVVENEWDLVTRIFEDIHREEPDILSVWNLAYDLKQMEIALKRGDILPENVFCDPRVPMEFRDYRFMEGRSSIPDANGKAENVDVMERWHRVYAPSTFFWADQMVIRRLIRKHKSKEPSYKLGRILEKTFGFGKLKGDDCPDNINPETVDWHKWMQRWRKVFYCVYNIFDNIGAQLLDDFTTDLKITFPQQCGVSDLESYGSQGRKLGDDNYFFMYRRGKILAGVSDTMETELDKYSVTLDGWICTLASHLVNVEMGNAILADFPEQFTKAILWVLDIDVKSSYPSTGVWMNISRETLFRVMCRIMGVDFEDQRRMGLNLPSGRVNSINIMRTICQAPRQIEMLERFVAKTGAKLKDI